MIFFIDLALRLLFIDLHFFIATIQIGVIVQVCYTPRLQCVTYTYPLTLPVLPSENINPASSLGLKKNPVPFVRTLPWPLRPILVPKPIAVEL